MTEINLRFISDDEIRAEKLFGGCLNVIPEILDVYAWRNISDDFTLIVYKKQENLVRRRFPKYNVTVLNSLSLSFLQRLTGHNMTGYISKISAWQRPLKRIDMIWYPITAPGQVMSEKILYCCIIHDLIALHNYDEGKQKSKYYRILAGTNEIFTISDYVKSNIILTFPEIDADKIHVIHDPISYDPTEPLEEVPDINRPYILNVNDYGSHKNPMTLLKAYESLIKAYDWNIDLVYCGAWRHDNCYNELLGYIKEHGLEDSVHLLYQVTIPQRNWLLNNAVLFVTPSLDEGFGMTPIEAAMRCVSVISTKETSLFEVTMGLVNYVNNPKDENELMSVMMKVLKDRKADDYEECLRHIADAFRKEYMPEKIALQYYEMLMKVQDECIKCL